MVIGVLSGLGELAFLLAAGLSAPVPAARRASGRLAARLVRWERRRLLGPGPSPTGPRAVGYLAARLLPTALGLLTLGLLVVGAVLAGIVLTSFAAGRLSLPGLLLQLLIGAGLLLVDLQALASAGRLDRWLAVRLLEPDPRAALQHRITELTASRAAVVAAVDAERRRIERDLHDGLQQQLVALGLLLGRARRSGDPDKARDLLAQAHADAQRAVDDLREVAWRVYPSALEHSTLGEVLTMVAQRSAVPVRIGYSLPGRPPPGVETVLYFVACEAVTNAAKHAAATVIDIEISANPEETVMVVRDDGTGGADSAGPGLLGLSRRVAALDGTFEVASPPGGGTTIRVGLPCG
jgi:signal transduction histidine kinase